MVNKHRVCKALEGVMDPELHKSLIELVMIRQVRIEDGEAQRLTLMQEHSSR
ncbi:MAG: iron-sulfur cluster assembly protein [Anaerolineae bacterium]